MSDDVYRERAHLVAFLAKVYPSVIGDSGDPDWPLVFIKTPEGQLSWHIARADMDLFRQVPPAESVVTWDGHTTEQKYERLDRLNPPTWGRM